MKNKIEVLAPAGSAESVKAAVRCGADAVYMGTKSFNARAKADNFSFEELKDTVDYCHSHDTAVHITMNTLISDDEIPAAKSTVERICETGADALILQDLGIGQLVRKACKGIDMHASTQMSVQTLSGVKLLKELGFKRAVLPRELSREEIKHIAENTDMEIECFVHGALCMCVSGQCYMSSMFGARSGNRGLCAQPCRLPFKADGSDGYDLSLKDLSLVQSVNDLADIGVVSLKIEGRMKRPEYVAAAVTSVVNSLKNENDEELNRKLRAVFSRSGFTTGYYEGKLGKDMFGTRGKDDVTAATNSVLNELSHLYEKETPLIPVSFYLSVLENEPVSLSASANGKTVFVSDEYIPEKALNKPLTKEGLSDRINKCGGTQFYAESIEVELDEGLIVPASVINNLRRSALESLNEKLSDVKEKSFTDIEVKIPEYKSEKPLKFNIRVASLGQIPHNLNNVENLYIPIDCDENLVEKVKNLPVNVGVEVPRGIFGRENKVKELLTVFKKCGINIAYCSTLDALAIARELGFEIHTGFSMNVFNSLSVGVLESLGVKEMTLSPELTVNRISKIGGKAKRGIIGYGRLPLMLTRNCPIKNGKTCADCKGDSYLTDRMGMKFPVMCKMGASEILNSQPIYMGDRLDEIRNVDFITFYFTKEKREMCEAVIDAYRKGKGVKGNFTRGLYYREVE
ncbi:MAG: U32 family peptidase [Clostridia bacterium]|nr:U32 family peptidase [Clostridia bacterium]